MYNNKYTKAVEIFSRIATKYKTVEIQKENIVEWCAACTINELRTAKEWFLFKRVKLSVDSNKQALMPCNVYRLLDIVDYNDNRIYAYDNGTYITLDEDTNYSYIYINYYGLPVDEQGTPLILKGTEKACEYYCITQLLEEDFVRGKISGSAWSLIEKRYEEGKAQAKATLRHMNRNDIQVLLSIMGNMAPILGDIPRYNLD